MSGRAIVFYDDDCNICRTIATTLLDWDRGRALRVAPIQGRVGDRYLGDLDAETRIASIHFIDVDGTRYSGDAALAPLFDRLPAGGPIAAVLRGAPGPVDSAYRWIARNRVSLSRWVPERLKARARRRVGEAASLTERELAG